MRIENDGTTMIAALDVYYGEVNSLGTAAAVVFAGWEDSAPIAEYTAVVANIQPYQPGEFFRRELPCLLAVLARIREPLAAIVIDGYVSLGSKPGLGQHLFDHLQQKIPVIGVAKTSFPNAVAAEVLRGRSNSPLYVTAIGVEVTDAAGQIKRMHGPHRVPTLLKRVDQISKGR